MTNGNSKIKDVRSIRVGVTAMTAATIVWMVIPILVKISLLAFDPILITTSRLLIASTLLIALYLLRNGSLRALTPITAWHLVGGIALGMNQLLFSFGLSLTTAAAGTVVIQVQIVALVLLSRLLLNERLSAIKIVSIAGIFIGSSLVIATPGTLGEVTSTPYRTGNLIMIAAGVCFGIFRVASSALSSSRGNRIRTTTEIVLPILVIALIVNLLFLPFSERPSSFPLSPVIAIAFLSVVGTAANYGLIAVAFQRLSAATAGAITAFQPPGVMILAAITLGDRLSPPLIAATLIVSLSVIAIMRDERTVAKHSRKVDKSTLQ